MTASASIVLTPATPLETEGECAPGALLGEGGMANVWLARNEPLDLPIALKIVRRQIRGSETAARLLTEARVQANLRHPNVARVYDYGQTASGDAFIVMELLEGYSLADWLEREGALSPVLAVQIMLPIIDALCALHRTGVIHRDLKPDNIFISHPTAALCPKLLDFGIAKISHDSNPRLTGRGGVVGSPAYMAPEQARGFVDCDERVDVWAACVVLYETLTGKPAFDGANHLALMIAVIEQELAPLTSPECEGLWPILSAGLEKERDLRTSSMLTFGAQLAQWLAERGASQDLGGEPVHWRYAFAVSDAGTALTARSPSQSMPRVRSGAAFEVCEASTTSRRERRQSELLFGNRRSPTPPSAEPPGRRTVSFSPGSVRRAAAARLAVAAILGGGLLMLGLNHGPLAWLSPRPKAAFAAEGAAAMVGAFIAKPAPTDPLVQLPAASPEAAPALYEPQATSTRPVFARTVRAQADRSQKGVATPPPGATPKARATRTTPAARSANVVTVTPRVKPVQTPEPSEAELGLKNPW